MLSKLNHKVFNGISYLFMFLWLYTVSHKLIGFGEFRWALFNQPLPHWLSVTLLFFLPFVELAAVLLLAFGRYRYIGMLLSLSLMLAFTAYVGLVLTDSFDRVPCACAGILEKMDWSSHLAFNLILLALSLLAIFFHLRERRSGSR
ncbi:MAG: hypothetical protein EOO88_19945 [Pedobacter sp.]|nr:MAG: hypothetical protein EOO88_19945 [Pedobacter sp.]